MTDQGDRMLAATRWILVVLHTFVALTAFAGGVVLVLSAVVPGFASSWAPSPELLAGSPFSDYLVPGLVLFVVIGGSNAAADVLELTRARWASLASVVAGYALLIWVFVQMIFIDFSPLQAAYFVLGAAQIALVLLRQGIFAPEKRQAAP